MTTRRRTRREPLDFNTGWKHMQTGITKLNKVLAGLPEPEFSYKQSMKLYTVIYTMCTQEPPHNYSEQLYDKYKEVIKEYITFEVLPSLGDKHGNRLLRELVKRWLNHKVMVKWLSRFFIYLDSHFIERKSLPPVGEAGIILFRELVDEEIMAKARDVILALVFQEREGELVDRALLKSAAGIYVDIGMGQMDFYEKEFETYMLADSHDYYSRKAAIWIVKYSCVDYMLKVKDCLETEECRVKNCFHEGSWPKLSEMVRNDLLVPYSSRLLEKEHSECCTLLRDRKFDDMLRMLRFFSKISKGSDLVANMLEQHLTLEGMSLNQQVQDAASNEVFSTAGECGCFANHTILYIALEKVSEVFCNKTGRSSSDPLTSYCHDILRKGESEKHSKEGTDDIMEKVVMLLTYFHNIDHFAKIYRKKIGENDDHEKSIISQLKEEFWQGVTCKMDSMVTDVVLAKENHIQFNNYLRGNSLANPGIDLKVSVLTPNAWPTFKSCDLNLPAEMAKCVELYNEFYMNKGQNRKLRWIYSLGSCNVNGYFDQKTIELILGTYQAAALLLFNASDKLSFSEIKTRLNLDDEDVVTVLQSLSHGKYEILTKVPRSTTVCETDVFHFNSNFTNKKRRIMFPLLSKLAFGKKKVSKVAVTNQKHVIEACIVRIMKSRKVLHHQQLILECVEKLGSMFKPDIQQTKQTIEDLITREYLKRDKENPDVYKYLA